MTSALIVVVSALLVATSAFFVAVEFALVAARAHRLEELARSSRSARAALRSARDLSLLLAGSQLGITLCTLALGAITKPFVHHALEPVLTGFGIPVLTADAIAFVLALIVVTFVHLVVGEMAPKSWAIAHPERSAVLLAIPMRGWMAVTRPLLVALNAMANRCLRKVGVEPVDEVGSGQTPDDLRALLDHSAKVGSIDALRHERLSTALAVQTRPVSTVAVPLAAACDVAPGATPAQVRAAAHHGRHLRLLVREPGSHPLGVVHVRDALGDDDTTATGLMREVPTLPGDLPIYAALGRMRESRHHLVLVGGADGAPTGLVTLDDLLRVLLPPDPSAEG